PNANAKPYNNIMDYTLYLRHMRIPKSTMTNQPPQYQNRINPTTQVHAQAERRNDAHHSLCQ
ncbi:hypothetical protein SARC_17953, partial [Sphaeroforma arctica JP610]